MFSPEAMWKVYEEEMDKSGDPKNPQARQLMKVGFYAGVCGCLDILVDQIDKAQAAYMEDDEKFQPLV